MKFEKITRSVGRLKLITSKNAPKTLFVVGIVGFGATIVAASRAAIKAKEINGEMTEALATFTTPAEDDQIKLRAVKEYAKAYAPTIALGVITIAALTKSHNMLTARNVALVASFTGLDKAFKEYRARVVEEEGVEKDRHYAHGTTEGRTVQDGVDEHGQPILRQTHQPLELTGEDVYKRSFDEYNRHWGKELGYNVSFLHNQMAYFNLQLRRDGHVFLNDVLKSLGYDPTPAGQTLGWLYDSKTGDNYISFGYEKYPDFVAGFIPSVTLEFNCDGIIYDKI